MEGSFANDETEGSSESSEEVHSAPQQAYLSRVSHQAARITSGKHASGTPPPPSAKRRSETAESSTSKLKNVGAQDRNQGLASTQPSRAPSVTGASLRGSSRGQPCGQDLGGSESEPSSDSDEFETRAPAFAPGPNRLSKVTGQGLRGHARPPSSSGSLYGRRYGGSASQANLNRPPSGMQSQKIGPKTDSTAHLPRLLSPPQSVEHLPISNRAARPSSVSGAGGGRQFYSSVQSPAPSQATFSNYRLLDGQASRNFHGASSAGGLSARATTHGDKRLMLESVGGDTLPRPDVDQALQSIQASLAALHERLNRVEGKSPRSRNGGGGLGSSHKGLFQGFFEALANALHDVSVLLGLSSPIPRAEGFAVPSFGSVGNSSRGSIVTGRAAAAAHLVTVPVQIFTIILKIAFRLALDVTSMVLLVCVFLFVFKRITGKGDPLFWLRIMRRWVRSRGARNSQVSS
ncbi:hypothetical protein IE53DRAFT_60313 [Violaceomyces palustris]|uniref:Uncharacterized protein n=1 Tax=Violaceomyces palustris TaxID=1673888 RepID=A0ACD0NZD0_9BASI|nr:hypothetical protein IE53DRAFT_60313 [Violaceomyces palustris]